MASYAKVAQDFRDSEDRLSKLMGELFEYRRRAKECNYSDLELVARGEKVFDAAKREHDSAEKLLAKLRELHESHYRAELARALKEAQEALAPLARAHRIASRAFGASSFFPTWVTGKFSDGLMADAEASVSQETTAIPLDPPKSFVLELADEEVW